MVVVFTVAVLVADSMGEASAAVDVSAGALSTVVDFVVAVLVRATGVATGAIIDSLMMSSSAATAPRGGGAGTIRTDIMATTITRTITMDTADTRTMDTAGTVTTVVAVTYTAMAADLGIRGVSGVGDKPVRLFETACSLVRVERLCDAQCRK